MQLKLLEVRCRELCDDIQSIYAQFYCISESFVFNVYVLYRIKLDPTDPYKLTEEKRTLGLCVCRGPGVMVVMPMDGAEEIENPFLSAEAGAEGPVDE